jgi:peptidoglycan/LPS O-acetylase OafA/YrhL
VTGRMLPNSHSRMPVGRSAYRLAVGVAVAAAIMLVWLSLGVGIIGQDGDPANRMYFGVLAVGGAGALVARLRAPGMARVLLAMAFAQALVAAIALVAGLGLPYSGPAELLGLNGFFIAMFAGSAWLFRRASGGPLERKQAWKRRKSIVDD